jgi:hypothetical protein
VRHLRVLGPMSRHGQNGWRKWAAFIVGWFIAFAVTGGGAAWEAVRLADARGTVASGWAAGIVAGVGVGLALEALVAVPIMVQFRRRRPVAKPKAMLFLALTIVLLVFVAFVTSAPPKNPGPVPYVTTSAIGVAEISYACTFLAQFALGVVAWLVAVLRQRRPLID